MVMLFSWNIIFSKRSRDRRELHLCAILLLSFIYLLFYLFFNVAYGSVVGVVTYKLRALWNLN